MLGIMSRAEIKGTLTVNGKPLTSKELAKIVSAFPDEVERLLIELEFYEVFSRLEDGTIYNRRMKKESDLSRKRAESGRLGGLKQSSSKRGDDVISKSEATLESDNEDVTLLIPKEEILILWCEFAERHGLTKIKAVPPGSKRERSLNARLADKDFDFKSILMAVEESPFLLGKKTDFKVTFDWILAPSNYQKIIEGNYRGTTPLDGPRQWLKEQEAKDANK